MVILSRSSTGENGSSYYHCSLISFQVLYLRVSFEPNEPLRILTTTSLSVTYKEIKYVHTCSAIFWGEDTERKPLDRRCCRSGPINRIWKSGFHKSDEVRCTRPWQYSQCITCFSTSSSLPCSMHVIFLSSSLPCSLSASTVFQPSSMLRIDGLLSSVNHSLLKKLCSTLAT